MSVRHIIIAYGHTSHDIYILLLYFLITEAIIRIYIHMHIREVLNYALP